MMKRRFSIISRLGLSDFTYSSTERQSRQNFLASTEDKFRDVKLLASSWSVLDTLVGPNNRRSTGEQKGKSFDPVTLAMEVQDLLASAGIECLISGSLALATMTQPRMTKDVDFNVNVSEKEFDRLKTVFNSEGHQLLDYQRLKAKAGIKPPYDKEYCAVTILEYKGINMDIFLNTCKATQWAHESARTINNRKFLSLECLAYFKLFAIDPKYKRYYKDMADLVNIVEVDGFRSEEVEKRSIEVFGEESKQVRILRGLVERRRIELEEDSWWKTKSKINV